MQYCHLFSYTMPTLRKISISRKEACYQGEYKISRFVMLIYLFSYQHFFVSCMKRFRDSNLICRRYLLFFKTQLDISFYEKQHFRRRCKTSIPKAMKFKIISMSRRCLCMGLLFRDSPIIKYAQRTAHISYTLSMQDTGRNT